MSEKAYVTFGQSHTHRVNNATLDKDCVAVVFGDDYSGCRANAFKLFGDKFHNCYSQDDFAKEKHSIMKYFPRGLINAMPDPTA